MHIDGFRLDFVTVAASFTAERSIVGIEEHLVVPLFRNTDAVFRPFHIGEIADCNDLFAAPVYAAEGDDRIVLVIRGNPREALPRIVHLPKRFGLFIKAVDFAEIGLQCAVRGVVQQQPVEPLREIPLDELPEFLPHKHKLFTGMRHHIADKRTHPRKFFFVGAGHFVNQRLFAVHHLVMGNRQYKVFGKRIEQRKCDTVVIVFAEKAV